MYVAVIRGDIPGPLFLGDLETISQTNFPTEPVGQTVYISRPNPTVLTNYLGGLDPDGDPPRYQGSGGVPAGIEGSAHVTFPLTLTSGNNAFIVQTASGGPTTTVTIATGTYTTMTSLLAAVNLALAGTGAVATTDKATGTIFILESTAVGVGSYIGVGAGTFNGPVNLASSQNFTMPSATTIITAMIPVGGPLLITPAAILTNFGSSPAAAGAASLIAPQLVETTAAIQSFQVGMISKFLELTYNPDSRLMPALVNGPAIAVVQNDGTSVYTAPLPIITAAVHNAPNAGDITITGLDLGNSEFFTSTSVVITGVSPGPGLAVPSKHLNQSLIMRTFTGGTQGVVSPTSIVIPASLLTTISGVALGVAGSTVEVKFTTLANTNYGTAATVSSVASGVATLTGLTNMTLGMVGGKITLSGAASSGNNGTFFIASYISATSVTITNIYAVAGDANNGSIVWRQPAPIAFVVT